MLKDEIQKRITQICEAGSFYPITYVDRIPTTDINSPLAPSGIVVNQVSGEISRSVSTGARDGRGSMVNWLFEALIKFDSEVDSDKFLTEELMDIHFTYNNEVRVVATPSFQADEPTRQGQRLGTELVINFTINTRR